LKEDIKMSNMMNFTSDKVDVFLMLIDRSGSMDRDEQNVIKGLQLYQQSFQNFPEKGSIAVSVSQFNEDVYLKSFTSIDEMDTSYYTDGKTALYYSICKGARFLEEYIQEIISKKSIIPKATFIVFSDGEPCNDHASERDGAEAIRRLNLEGVTTVFVAFGNSIESKFGERLGFMSTKDVRDRGELEHFLGVELSKSCKEQSKSMKGLGSNFFSQATTENSSSAGYSGKTAQVLEDDNWINDL